MEPKAPFGVNVAGFCPQCGKESLFLGHGGRVTCSRLTCPRPSAADEILGQSETHHILTTDQVRFTVWHPLRERLDDALMNCALYEHITVHGQRLEPGRYRVTEREHSVHPVWDFTKLDEEKP